MGEPGVRVEVPCWEEVGENETVYEGCGVKVSPAALIVPPPNEGVKEGVPL